MVTYDDQPEHCFRVVAVDPGTNTLGVAVLDIYPDVNHIKVRDAFTLHVDKLYMRYPHVIECHGDRVAKLHAVTQGLYKHLMNWLPHAVVSEAPYMGRFPQAYAALVECVSAIRRAVDKYDRGLPFPTIDPATVKKSVGVSGKSGDKNAVKQAITKMTNIAFDPGVDVEAMDEHAIDAIAVGCCFYKQQLTRN